MDDRSDLSPLRDANALEDLKRQLIEHEGLIGKPYPDSRGKLTIGVGHNLTDVGLSEAQCLRILEDDIDCVLIDLREHFLWFLTLDPIRQRAVADLRFNLGAEGFREFRHFIAAMARENYLAAADELRASRWHRQVGERARTIERQIQLGED